MLIFRTFAKFPEKSWNISFIDKSQKSILSLSVFVYILHTWRQDLETTVNSNQSRRQTE